MGRPSETLDHLARLVDWAGGRAAFCEQTGIRQQNLSAYLNGTKRISWQRLESATRAIFGTPPAFVPALEMHDLKSGGAPSVAEIGRNPGVYALFDSAYRVVYFGKATDLYAEIRQTLDRKVTHVKSPLSAKAVKFRDIAAYLSAYRTPRGDVTFRHDLESLVLRVVRNSTFNKNFGHFTRTE
jgi:hypothetical protein